MEGSLTPIELPDRGGCGCDVEEEDGLINMGDAWVARTDDAADVEDLVVVLVPPTVGRTVEVVAPPRRIIFPPLEYVFLSSTDTMVFLGGGDMGALLL